MSAFTPEEIQALRSRFPILGRTVHGKPLVYLDNAATSQMPNSVIEAVREFDRTKHANVHRGVHQLSQEATDVHEGSRDRLAKFLNARRREEIVLTRGCTESINLVANTWGRQNLRSKDVVLVSQIEHHANIVPWQLIGNQTGSTVVPIPVLDDTSLDQDAFLKLLEGAAGPVKLLAIQHVSNAFGTIHPVVEMIRLARARGIATLVDGAQSVPHFAVDVQALDCDFLVFSGHKMHAPTGTGVLYGKFEVLDALGPWQGGGDMIDKVSFSGTTFHEVPYRFEAGTPNFTAAAGFTAALDFLEEVGMEKIHDRDTELVAYAHQELSTVPGLKILGTHLPKAGVVSFVLDGIHPYDAGMFLDQMGIAVRTGHHCAQPAMERFGVPGTIRASFAMFTTETEIDTLVEGVRRVNKILGGR